MAKKDTGKKKDPEADEKQPSRGDAVRAAAAQAIEATAGQAGVTRERAQQIADDLVHAANRFRETLEELRPAGSDELRTLRADPRVLSVEPDEAVRTTDLVASAAVPRALQTSAPWNLDRIDQPALPLSGTYTAAGDGAGVRAYVLDSGIRADHVEFGGRVLPAARSAADSASSSCRRDRQRRYFFA